MHKENMFNTYAQMFSAIRKYIILELFDYDQNSPSKYALESFISDYVVKAGNKIISSINAIPFEVFFNNLWHSLDTCLSADGESCVEM